MSDRRTKYIETVKKTTPGLITGLSSFPIVGIGASAGGLEALEQFFGSMPNDNGMAFVVIQHLDPNHAGMMPELLQRITPMKVFQAADRLKVKPNCVYVIPPWQKPLDAQWRLAFVRPGSGAGAEAAR